MKGTAGCAVMLDGAHGAPYVNNKTATSWLPFCVLSYAV